MITVGSLKRVFSDLFLVKSNNYARRKTGN